MEPDFVKLSINSTMLKINLLSGGMSEVARPCTVYAMYSEPTGTLVINHVMCDGDVFTEAELSAEEKQKFYDELCEKIINKF